MERVAQCHCGQLKAITTGEPERVYVCHCQACQRRTGAVVSSTTRWLKSQVRIEGNSKVYARKGASGFEINFHFCPDCGTTVCWEPGAHPKRITGAVGAFADPLFPAPRHSVYECRRHGLVDILGNIERLD